LFRSFADNPVDAINNPVVASKPLLSSSPPSKKLGRRRTPTAHSWKGDRFEPRKFVSHDDEPEELTSVSPIARHGVLFRA
jgi:hypothetical protein